MKCLNYLESYFFSINLVSSITTKSRVAIFLSHKEKKKERKERKIRKMKKEGTWKKGKVVVQKRGVE